jgi:hypothetical protein
VRRALPFLLTASCVGPATQDGSFGGGGATSRAASSGESGSSSSTGSSTDAGEASSSSSTSAASSTSTGGTTEQFPDFGSSVPVGCQGKIDFLFMISSGTTMAVFQENLKSALPGFLSTIQQNFADWDTHIMVVDSTKAWGLISCEQCDTVCETTPGYPCYVNSGPGYLDDCDFEIGAGVTFPAGNGSSNHRCELAGNRRYITLEDPDPEAAFECISGIGVTGGSRGAEAVFHAVGEIMNGPTGCNNGFVRDDALLVVTILQDNYDEKSEAWPEIWASSLVTIKGDDPDAVVLLVVTTDVDMPNGLCWPDKYNETPNRLRTFADLMPHGLVGSICEPDWTPFFDEAADLVLSQCEVFAPQ